MALRQRALAFSVLALVLSAAPASAATGCGGDLGERFRCTTLTVPLDREGVRSGTLRLPVAVEKPRPGARDWVLALSGGPGQSTLSAATFVAETHRPLRRTARLVVFDQRGTGVKGLSCPALQRLSAVDPVPDGAIGDCARRLGPSRADYTTSDSVEDIEALRKRLGARRITITGVSYGTYVAVQYARRYPGRVARLVLDSPVGPDGIDSFQLDSLSALPRVVSGWCSPRRCPASVGDPWASLRSATDRLAAGGLRARLPNSAGRMRSRVLPDQAALMRTLIAADLNPALQALLPASLAAAASGDGAPLLRLQRAVAGPRLPTRDLSIALNLATVCSDVVLPYGLTDDGPVRAARIDSALAAVPAERFAPFSPGVVRSESVGQFCTEWPDTAGQAPTETGPFPNVPALILSGGFDQRTPTENARALAAVLPRSELVTVAGTGHDTIDSDLTGCVDRALSRFGRGVRVGYPCRGSDNRLAVSGAAPSSVESSTRPSGSLSVRDVRPLGAIVATIQDARLQTLAQVYAGLPRAAGGGLRGGSFGGDGALVLRGYELISGVRLSGTDAVGSSITALLPDGRQVRMSVGRDRVRGEIDGRRFSLRIPSVPAPLS